MINVSKTLAMLQKWFIIIFAHVDLLEIRETVCPGFKHTLNIRK